MDGMDDDRIVIYGIRHYIENFINRVIEAADVDAAEKFYRTHGPGFSELAYPKQIFEYIREHKHYPVRIEALPEGSVVYPHTPVYIITSTADNSHFCTFLETILTMIWYPCSVATLSRHTKQLIEKAFDKSVDPSSYHLLESRLHDFGFRGCTCVEQSVIGGTAHLLNFDGSDTMSACYHAQFHLNGGVPVGTSLPATEHSVMTAWEHEIDAINNLIDKFPGTPEKLSLIACVMDSYDYDNALNKLLPAVIQKVITNNCTLVLRPDSGNPVKQVVKALIAAEKALRGLPGGEQYITVNEKQFKCLKHVAVIQGDGINYEVTKNILEEIMDRGYSAQNVAFGMGGGLLQKVNRDTMSFATKLSYMEMPGGRSQAVMKRPIGDRDKWSIPGKMKVLQRKVADPDNPSNYLMDAPKIPRLGPHMVYTEQYGATLLNAKTHEDSMKVVYDHGNEVPYKFESFADVRKRLNTQWSRFRSHMTALDETIILKQDETAIRINQRVNTSTQPMDSTGTPDMVKTNSIFTIKPVQPQRLESRSNPQSARKDLQMLDALLARLT